MQTDIELVHRPTVQRNVIDTKLTSVFTGSNYRDVMLKSGHVYQLQSYLRTQERADDRASLAASSMLLHPQTGGSVDESMVVQGHVMPARMIDLTALPGAFERALKSLPFGHGVCPRACRV